VREDAAEPAADPLPLAPNVCQPGAQGAGRVAAVHHLPDGVLFLFFAEDAAETVDGKQ
jgi:hypothetical protein